MATFTQVKEELNTHLTDYVNEITTRDGKMYKCPICGSGNHSNGTGAFSVKDNKFFKCFSCNNHGTIIDLYGLVNNCDFKKSIADLCNKYGIKQYDDVEEQKENDLTFNRIEIAKTYSRNVCNTEYLTKRGIPVEYQIMYNVGFIEHAAEHNNEPCVTFPTSKGYRTRNINPDSKAPRYKTHKSDKVKGLGLFNATALYQEYCYITEGDIDALSVLSCDVNACSLGSCGNYDELIEEVREIKTKPVLLLLLDNDQAGDNATREILRLCAQRRIVSIDMRRIIRGYNDVNEMLVNNRGLLEQYLKIPYKQLVFKFRFGTDLSSYLIQPQKEYFTTGFTNLDRALNGGITNDLYIIGATSSLGKTTFTMQIADTLASAGHGVIVFELEQSKTDLINKSLARIGFRNGNRHTVAEIAKDHNIISPETQKQYKAISRNLYIVEGNERTTADSIRQTVEEYIAAFNRKPLVIIDYLQIIPTGEKDDYNAITRITSNLARLKRDYDLPVIVISSFNRGTYSNAKKSDSNESGMSSFKGSGNIEYSADVLITLEDDITRRLENPRQITLKIIKNRNGSTSNSINMEFLPQYAMFSEVNRSSNNTQAQGQKKRMI